MKGLLDDHRAFTSFGKIPRLAKLQMIVTEKIDGTNAAVVITDWGDIYAQSRKRVVTTEDDNFGFAAWVDGWRHELAQLGAGVHFGEWWGLGIQRGYNLTERRFSLFNTHRWGPEENTSRPDCCHVVPTLYIGPFDPTEVDIIGAELSIQGSAAAPGYPRPEGMMLFIPELGQYVKHPFDPNPKGK